MQTRRGPPTPANALTFTLAEEHHDVAHHPRQLYRLAPLHRSRLRPAADRPFIAQRLASLRDLGDHHTQQFLRRWGEPHHRRVIGWFERALQDLEPTY